MPYLKSYGIEPEDFLPASCRRALATGEDITLNPSQYLDFLRTIDTTIPDKELLKLGTQSSLKQWVPAIFGALAADNGWEGLARFERYKKLTAPIDMHTTHEKNRCRVEFAFAGAERALPRSGVLLEQVILLTLMRTGTGRHIVPLFVEAPFEYSAEYTEFFGVTPRAASCNSLVFAQTGKHTHLKNAQGKPYPSPSEARLGFLAYLHRTGHTHQTTLKNITNNTWPALTHTYNKYQPTERQNLINHEWTLATTNPNGTPRTHTPKPPKNPIHYLLRQTTPTWATKPQNSRKKDHQTAIRQWWTLTETHGTTLYGGTQTALTTRLTLKALAARAHQHGNTTFPCSHRTLRLYTGLSLGTIQKTLKHLLNQKNPLIQLTHQGKLNTPNTYRLTIPNTHQKLAQTPYKKGPITPLPKAFYTLNKAAWFIYNTYTTPKTKQTHQELTKKTGISARRITATLKTLVAEGFLEETTKAGKKAWKIYKWCDLEELAWWTDGLVAYNEINDEITKQQKQWKKKCLSYHLSMKYVYTKFKKGINSLRGIGTGICLYTNMNSKVQRTRRGVLERVTCSDANLAPTNATATRKPWTNSTATPPTGSTAPVASSSLLSSSLLGAPSSSSAHVLVLGSTVKSPHRKTLYVEEPATTVATSPDPGLPGTPTSLTNGAMLLKLLTQLGTPD